MKRHKIQARLCIILYFIFLSRNFMLDESLSRNNIIRAYMPTLYAKLMCNASI